MGRINVGGIVLKAEHVSAVNEYFSDAWLVAAGPCCRGIGGRWGNSNDDFRVPAFGGDESLKSGGQHDPRVRMLLDPCHAAIITEYFLSLNRNNIKSLLKTY
jgi:hypothetical protein